MEVTRGHDRRDGHAATRSRGRRQMRWSRVWCRAAPRFPGPRRRMVVPCTAGMASHPKTTPPTFICLPLAQRPPLPSSCFPSRTALRTQTISLSLSSSIARPICISFSSPLRVSPVPSGVREDLIFFLSGRRRSKTDQAGMNAWKNSGRRGSALGGISHRRARITVVRSLP